MIDLSENLDTVDFFNEVDPFGSTIEENLDANTMKFIEDFAMNGMMTKVDPTFGTYTENENGYTATFTEAGSRAIESISLDNSNLYVLFRKEQANNTTYTFNATKDALEPLFNEIVTVLEDGQGSVGVVFNQLRRKNKIQLI